MYRITVEQHFDAAHFLRGYRGKCEAIHGHTFKTIVRIKAEKLNEIGIAYDFTDVKQHLRSIINRLDHVLLNEIGPFDKINPSSENIAVNIFNELAARLPKDIVALESVEVWESPLQGAAYYPD